MQDKGNKQPPWILSRSGVLVMLFVVLGALGIGLLWKSTAFSKKEKIWYSIAVVAYSAAIILGFVLIIVYVYSLAARMLEIH